MSNVLKTVNKHSTAQSQKAAAGQVKNNAGGFVFEQSEWTRLESFLINGISDKGSYYAKADSILTANLGWVENLLKQDAQRVLDTVVSVSDQGRAKSNSYAIFVVAMAMHTDGVYRPAVKETMLKVVRTATHLFEYTRYLKNLGGLGRAKRESIARWYTSKSPESLAYQAVKYRQRDGFTHRDMFRLAHPKGVDQNVGNFILGKDFTADDSSILTGFKKVQAAKTADEVVSLINEYRLPWEALPTNYLKDLKVWKTLFEAGMGQTALIRNTTRFAKLGAFNDLKFAKLYADKLADPEAIRKGRIHPFSYLNAAVVFEEGQVDRKRMLGWSLYRNKNWETNSKVLSGLHSGFYTAFGNVEPANKSTMVALDTSGSMTWYAPDNMDLDCMQVGAAVAMLIARTEPYAEIRGFSTRMVDLRITENDSLSQVMQKVYSAHAGGTDLAQPFLFAMKNKLEIETFVSITDNETWAGAVHPFQALKSYRQAAGIEARSAVFGVVSNGFTIANPDDPGMMDFIGFDSHAPNVLTDFSAGRI